MPSTNNLASYFSAAAANNAGLGNMNSGHDPTSASSKSQGNGYSSTLSIFGIDPSQSNAVHAEDDEAFEKSSYQLKRTRSMGLLDHYIAPTKKLIEEDFSHTNHFKNDPLGISKNSSPQSRKSLSSKNLDQLNRDLSISSGSNVSNNINNNDGNHGQDSIVYSPALDNSPCSFAFHSSDLKSPCISDDKTDPNFDGVANNASSFSVSSGESPTSVYSTENSMSTYNPSTSPVVTTGEILQPHDDTDIIFEPKNRVDYFSYDWTDRELLRSWRYVVDQKKCTDNAERLENTRLENASWRTWARAKYCLKTVTPESINWKKDKDVSWLYGPKCNPETESDALNNLCENKIKIINNANTNSNEVNVITSMSSDNDDNTHQHENTIPHNFNDIAMSYSSVNTSNSSIPLSQHSNFQASQSSQQIEEPISSTAIPTTISTDSIIIPQYVKPILKQRKISEKINAHSELFKLNISQERKIKQQQHQQSMTSPVIAPSSNSNSPVVSGLTDNELHRVASPLVLMSSPTEPSSSAMDIDQFPDDKQNYFVQSINSDSDDSYEDDDEESRKKKENKKLLKSSFLVVPTDQDESEAKRSRRIHFNDRVEQCRIVDYYSDSEEEEEFFNKKNSSSVNTNAKSNDSIFKHRLEKDKEADHEDEDHDGGLIFSTTGASSQQSSSMRQLSRTSSTQSSISHCQAQRFKDYPKIIEPIPAIKIRFRGDESSEEESDFESEDEDNYQWLLKNNNAMYNNDIKGYESSASGNHEMGGVVLENRSLCEISANNSANNNSNNNSSGRRNDFYNYNSVYMPESLPLNENYRNDMNAYYNNIAKSYMNSAAHTANTGTNAKSSMDDNSYSLVHDDDGDDDDIEMEDVPQNIAVDLQNQVLDDSLNGKNESNKLLSRESPSPYTSLTSGRTNSFNSSMNQLAIGGKDNEAPALSRPHSSFLTKKPSSTKNLSLGQFGSSSSMSFAQNSPFNLQQSHGFNKSGTTMLSNSNAQNNNREGAPLSSFSRENSGLLRNNSKPCFSFLEEDDSSDEEIKDVPLDIMIPSKDNQYEQNDICPVKFIANKSGFLLADDDNYDDTDTESDEDDGNVFNFSHTNHRENISSANLASLNNLHK